MWFSVSWSSVQTRAFRIRIANFPSFARLRHIFGQIRHYWTRKRPLNFRVQWSHPLTVPPLVWLERHFIQTDCLFQLLVTLLRTMYQWQLTVNEIFESKLIKWNQGQSTVIRHICRVHISPNRNVCLLITLIWIFKYFSRLLTNAAINLFLLKSR